MEIKEYKGYQYIVYNNKNIYFKSSLYIYHGKDLESRIKMLITKTKNEYESLRNYYDSIEYCNSLVEEELKEYDR